MKKRLTIGLIVGATVFAAVFAMAATLNITSNDLAAGDQVVAGCDPDGVTTSYTTAFDGTTDHRYEVTHVTVGGIALDADTGSPAGDGCDGQDISVTLRDTDNNVVGSGTFSNITASSHSVDITADVSAEGATQVHVLIAN